MSPSEDKKKRGGARKGAGRKKQAPPPAALDGRSAEARGIAHRVLQRARSEELWYLLIQRECTRLGIEIEDGKLVTPENGTIDSGDFQGSFSILPLFNVLKYLECRDQGNPVDTVNHVHDKPFEMNVNVSMAEIVREVRQRKENYERGRK